MRSSVLISFTLGLLPLAPSAAPVARRAVPSTPFHLYAFGQGISGFQVFVADGLAYVGNCSRVLGGASVEFTADPDDDSALVANSTLTYYLPKSSARSQQTGFSYSPVVEGASTSNFVFYGATALHLSDEDAGALEALWYVTATETEGVYRLNWNADGKVSATASVSASASATETSVSLRKVAPSGTLAAEVEVEEED